MIWQSGMGLRLGQYAYGTNQGFCPARPYTQAGQSGGDWKTLRQPNAKAR